MKFEFIKNNHTDINFTKIINNFFHQHNLQYRLNVMIFDNFLNNGTLFFELMKNMIIALNYVNVTNNETNVKKSKITHVSYLTHVLQLTLQIFLKNVRINFINDEFQKN